MTTGVEVLVAGFLRISADERAEFLELIKPVVNGRIPKKVTRRYRVLKIDRDQDMKKFVLERLPTMTQKEILDATAKRFGHRAPSKSGLNRFAKRWRSNPPADVGQTAEA